MMIWALILAAGKSRRMGKPKMLLPFEGKTIIEKVVQNALNSQVDNTLVVLGANSKRIQAKISKSPVHVTLNPQYAKGMLSSVQWGFQHVLQTAEAVVVLLGDQPSIPPSVIDKIIAAYRKSRKGIVVPIYKGRRGHPVLIDTKYREEIQKLDPEKGLRSLVYSHAEDIREVEASTSSVLKDIDFEEDYRRELDSQS